MNLQHIATLIRTGIIFLILTCLCVSFGQSNRDSQSKNKQDINHEKIYNGKDTDVKAFLLTKVEPTYTKKARKHKVEGTVILRCIFSSTGEVTNIVVVSRLPDGLTEKAIEAARQIKFKPAMKDGKPVSMYMQLEYNFNLQ